MSRPATTRAGRQRKLACPACGFIAYASAGAVISCGLPTCGCGQPLTVANPRDLAVIDPESFEELRSILPMAGHNAMVRAAGYDGLVVRSKGHDPRVARARALRQKRCSVDGCGRFAAKGTSTCELHATREMSF